MSEISTGTLDYMLSGIKHVCLNYKNRSAGSKSEKECQKYFKKELSNWADQVDEETFTLHPKAFMGSILLTGLINIVSVILFWLSIKIGSIILLVIGAVTILFSVLLNTTETFLYCRLFDFLFPKAVSKNIMAKRAPNGEVKRRIIFGAHADAAYEMTYTLHGQLKTTLPVLIGSSLGSAFVLISNIMLFIHSLVNKRIAIEGIWTTMGIIEIAFIPFFIAVVFFTNWSFVVDGANDNLSACYVAMSVLKEMKQKNLRFENTEVCCLITGSEEAGLRGSLAYSEQHAEELLSVETIFIALDTMRENDKLKSIIVGQNGLVKNSVAVGELLNEAGENCGKEIEQSKLIFGASDAESFSRKKIRSCGFCGADLKPQLYYHTRYDTWDNISEECLQLSLEICLEASRLYDQNEGIIKYENIKRC